MPKKPMRMQQGVARRVSQLSYTVDDGRIEERMTHNTVRLGADTERNAGKDLTTVPSDIQKLDRPGEQPIAYTPVDRLLVTV